MAIKCFWIEPTSEVRLWLRRYADRPDRKCDLPHGYHDAMRQWQDVGDLVDERGCIKALDPEQRPGFDDPRWPERCACGYVFQLDDQWDVFRDRIYSNGLPLREQPAGAMYDAYWYPEKRRGADGKCLIVVLPDGHTWNVDGPASNGPGWTREGVPPLVTARPSIQSPKWHGYLTAGELVEC